MRLEFAFTVRNRVPYVPAHTHAALELVYYVSGEGSSVFRGKRHGVGRNFFAVYPRGVKHDQTNDSPITTLCLGVRNSGLEPCCGCWRDPEGLLRRPVEQVFREMDERQAGHREVIRGLLLEIRGYVQRLAREPFEEPPKKKIVARALSLIRENEGRVSLTELSDQLFVSKDYLRHLLTRETRQAPIRHIIRARIEKAKALLRSGKPVKEVALEAGFEDIFYFSRIFKKETGRTPTGFAAR